MGKKEELLTRSACVYRFFDKDDNLLYVGATYNAITRIGEQSGLRKLSTKVLIEHYPSRLAALDAEALAIRTENPRLNDYKPKFNHEVTG